jgi:hypothetical protein
VHVNVLLERWCPPPVRRSGSGLTLVTLT